MTDPALPVNRHISVLPEAILTLLDPQPGETWVDCTLGAAGHTRLLAERVGKRGRVVALEQDPAMLARARSAVKGLPVTLVEENFEYLAAVLAKLGLASVNGVLADLGISSDQLDDPERGLSFQREGPLDMRLAPIGPTAADLVNTMPERELADIIYQYGEERLSRRIAHRITQTRRDKPIRTTQDLAALVRQCVPRSKGHGIDPATRTFQALRIAVNDELGVLERLLKALPGCVRPGGRAGIISFHSLEDRLVKRAFRESDVWQVVTKKPIVATESEIAQNPRSRSAKLRVARRAS